jgi:hypothetical protein
MLISSRNCAMATHPKRIPTQGSTPPTIPITLAAESVKIPLRFKKTSRASFEITTLPFPSCFSTSNLLRLTPVLSSGSCSIYGMKASTSSGVIFPLSSSLSFTHSLKSSDMAISFHKERIALTHLGANSGGNNFLKLISCASSPEANPGRSKTSSAFSSRDAGSG